MCMLCTEVHPAHAVQATRLFAELKKQGQDSDEVHSALVEAFCR